MDIENCVVAVVLKTPQRLVVDGDERLVAIREDWMDRDKLASAIGDLVGLQEFEEILAGLVSLRTTGSSELTQYLLIRVVERNMLTTTNVFSAEALERLENGGALVSLGAAIDNTAQEGSGHPVLSGAQSALLDAIAMVVARLNVLDGLVDKAHQPAFKVARAAVSNTLDKLATSMFNLNKSHYISSSTPALDWCEVKGPKLLADAYGLDWTVLELQLAKAFRDRIRRLSLEATLRYETELLFDLCQWAHAHNARRTGELSRADTIKRAQGRTKSDHPSEAEDVPPRMHEGVRNNLIAERRLALLSGPRMIELALLFDLTPAHDVFLTRQYLLPVLAVASFVGELVLRRQDGLIDGSLTAGGLIALAGTWSLIDSRKNSGPDLDPNIVSLQQPIANLLSEADYAPTLLSQLSKRYLRLEDPRSPKLVAAKEGLPRYFLD